MNAYRVPHTPNVRQDKMVDNRVHYNDSTCITNTYEARGMW